jgi:chromosome segregation ATPase
MLVCPTDWLIIKDTLDADTPESKRQRIHSSQELTQITTQSTAPTSQNLDLTARLQSLENLLVEMKANHAAEVDRLQTTIIESEARYRERIQGWEDLQHRYEAQNNELHKVRKERDALLEDKTNARIKAGKQEDEITKLKDERKQLKQDLQSARDALKTEGGLKEELEVLREQNRKLSEDYAKLEKSVEYEKKQTESARRAYQDASHHAGMLKNETTTLQDRVAYLQSQVDAEAVKLSELKKQNDESKHSARVKELEQTLEARETLLRKKEEELRTLRNNRPATRATSTQPRSPKAWGNNGSRPTSPGVNNGVGNRSSGLRFSSEMSF